MAVQAARYSKKGSKEAEVGLLAVEALHKQVMPFVLRRTKAQVRTSLRVSALGLFSPWKMCEPV
jgi:TATA-binding protein-associated factor